MKKRLIAAFLCLALLCALLPGTALAANATIVRIAGMPLSSNGNTRYVNGGTTHNNPDGLWNAYFDAANNVLYLKSLEVTNCSEQTAIEVNGGITLNLVGMSTVAMNNNDSTLRYGLHVQNGDLTVTGSGTLNVTCGAADSASYGVYVQGGSITVTGGTLTGTGGAANNTYGVCASGSVTVTGGTLTGTGGADATTRSQWSVGLSVNSGGVTVSGTGRVEATGADAEASDGIKFPSSFKTNVSGNGYLLAKSADSATDSHALYPLDQLVTDAGLLALGSDSSSGTSPEVYTGTVNYKWVEVNKARVTVTPSTSFPAGNAGTGRTITVDSGVAGFNATNNFAGATLGGRGLDLGTAVRTGGKHGSFDNGSIVITLNAAYLNTLTPGTYPLVVTLKDGAGVSTGYAGKQATTNIIVTGAGTAAAVPKTGDGTPLVLLSALALLSGAGLLLSRTVRKRKETH